MLATVLTSKTLGPQKIGGPRPFQPNGKSAPGPAYSFRAVQVLAIAPSDYMVF